MFQNEQIQAQLNQLEDKTNKIKELETALFAINKRCGQFEDILEQQINRRNMLESENQLLSQTLSKLRSQINELEKIRYRDEEKINLLNATLIERETEVSILKLKLTRVQTNLTNSTYSNASIITTNNNTPKLDSTYSNALYVRQSSNAGQDQNARAADQNASRSSLTKNIYQDSPIWSQGGTVSHTSSGNLI